MACFYPPRPLHDLSIPRAELRVWHALSALGDDWHVLHHVPWQSVRWGRQADGEADFVLVHARHGLVVLEVKSGRPVVVQGSWYTREGTRLSPLKNPFDQAKDSTYSILRYLAGLGTDLVGHPAVNYGVVFPDVEIDGGQDFGLHGRVLVIDGEDLRHPRESLARLIAHWRPSGPELSRAQVQEIVARLAPTLELRRPLKAAIRDVETEILRLTDKQLKLFDALRRNRRLAVVGRAGTGKTILAMEKARQLARDGADVLLTCFNAPLEEWIFGALRDEVLTGSLRIERLHSICRWLSGDTAANGKETRNRDWYEKGALDVLRREVDDPLGLRFDAIVVDEAQDFSRSWLAAIMGLLRDPRDSPLYLFADDEQSLRDKDGFELPPDLPVLSLDENCRNSLPIAQKVAELVAAPLPTEGPPGPGIWFVEAEHSDLVPRTRSVVQHLVARERLGDRELVVMSDATDLVIELRHDRNRLLLEERPAGIPYFEVDTIHRFKGLEADVVIVVCSARLEREPPWMKKLLYVGFSRARSHLVVVGSRRMRRKLGLQPTQV